MTVSEREAERVASSGLLGPRLAAVALVVLSIVLIWSALGIRRGGGFNVIGPGTVPLVVAVILLVLSVILVVRTTVAPDVDLGERANEEELACYWPTVGLVAVALVGYAVALDGVALGPLQVPGIGFVVATGIFLPVVSRILGSRSIVRDVVVGFGLAVVVYVGFTEFLGVRLPAGVLGLIG